MISVKMKYLQGVIVPVITPLTGSEKLNRPALEKLLNSLIDAGVNGIFLGGSAGLGPLLSERNWEELMHSALRITGSRCQLLAGVIETSSARAVKKIKLLETIGYDTIVVTPTFYIKLQYPWEFMNHFQICRDAANVRMLAYNIPSCTGSEIPLECIKEMCRKHWIDGLKESSADNDYMEKVIEIAGEYGVKVFQGSESNISWALERNVDGIVPVCANFDPELFVKTWKYREDPYRLAECQRLIDQHYVDYIVGDGNRSWISGVVSETAKRHHLADSIVSAPLGKRPVVQGFSDARHPVENDSLT